MTYHTNGQDEAKFVGEGLSRAEQEQYVQANADFEVAIERNEQFVAHYIELAVALADRGSRDHAIGLYDMMIQLNPDDAMLYRARGGSYEAISEYEQAIPDYGEAVRLDPG